jgi:hypothetical protein
VIAPALARAEPAARAAAGLVRGRVAGAALLLAAALATGLGQERPDTGPGGRGSEAGPQGSLRAGVPQSVGVYVLQHVEEAPQLLAAGATDALVAGYRSPEGVAIQYTMIAYPSEASAEAFLREVEAFYRSQGFEVKERGPVPARTAVDGGRFVRMEGDREMLAWTNRRLFEGADGPIGEARAFADAHFANYPF